MDTSTRTSVARLAGAAALALVATTSRAAVAQEAFDDRGVGEVAIASPPTQLAVPPPPPAPAPAQRRRTVRRVRAPRGDDAPRGADESDDLDLRERLTIRAGPLTVEPEVLLQVQAVPYVGGDASAAKGDPSDRAGFLMRRARFGFEGRLFHRIPFEINAEFNSEVAVKPTAVFHDAWFGYDPIRFLQIYAGAMDVPFSRSALTGAGESALIERPFAVRALAPFHQLGARIQGHLWSGTLSYDAGIYNGLERAAPFFAGYVESPALLGHRPDGLTYAGRITSEPLGDLGRTTEDLHRGPLRIAAGTAAFYSSGSTGGVLGMGGDFLLHFRGLHLLGEFLANRAVPPPAPAPQPRATTSLGAVAEAGYVLLRERLGITARFEWIDPDTAARAKTDSWVLTGGASYHVLNDFLKAQLDYTHRQELHGSSLRNDALVFQVQLNL